MNDVIQKATAKNPAHRYHDALAMAAAFRDAAELGQNGQSDELVESLTLREQEILRFIVDGCSNKEIAQSLFVELPTVKWHITKIYKKLGVRSRVQAIVRARELNLIVFTSEDEIEIDGPSSVSIVLPEPVNPYKGLMAFEPADNRHFFGREALLESLLSRLAGSPTKTPSKRGENGEGRFLAIVGPSGSGKSSLVKAGIIPALWSGRLPGSDKWFIINMAPGARPLDELEIALTRIAANQAVNLREHLDRDNHGLCRVAGLVLPNNDSELVLVVDQFEELFTLVEDESTRSHFMALLQGASTDPRGRVRVIITLRADLYDRPLRYPAFGKLMRDHMETLLPLSAEELERAIVYPANEAGVAFEAGLVATIIEDVHYRPGALPLMQYALTELFEQRQGRTLSREAYAAIGGVAGALARRAEELYQEQGDQGREAIHQMFLRLVAAGTPPGDPSGGASFEVPAPPDIRKRVPHSELLSAAANADLLDDIIDTFASYRLLSLDHHPATRQPTVEVAHEAILREWNRLRIWLEESRADLNLHRQLIRATGEWLAAGKEGSFLLRGARLNRFESWAADTPLKLAEDEQAFLDASLARREEIEAIEQQRREHQTQLEQRSRQRLKALIVVMAVALVVAVGLSILAFNLARQAEEQRRLAVVRELASAAQSNLESNPELSVLLALEAAEITYAVDGTVLPEVEQVLHRSVQADRNQITIPKDGAMAFTPNGEMLAIGEENGDLALRGTTKGQQRQTFESYGSSILDVAFSPDGRYLAAAGANSSVKIWDVSNRWPIMSLDGIQGPVFDIAFAPDGKRLATAGEDGLVRIWDVTSLPLQISSGDSKQRAVLNHQSEPALTLSTPAKVSGIAISADGRRIAAYIPGASITIWDTRSGQQIQQISRVSDSESGLAFSPDGEYLVGSSGALGATIWDVNTGQEVLALLDSSPITSAAFIHDGDYLGTAARDGSAALWDMKSGRQILKIPGQSTQIRYIAFSQDGRQMAMGSGNGMTRIWDLTVAGSAELFAIAAHEGEVYDVIYNATGTRIASAGEDGTVKIWDSATGELIHSLPGRSDGPHIPAFSPDGDRLASANDLGDVSIWDVESGKKQLTLSGDTLSITTIAYSPDGRQLAAATGREGVAYIWDTTNGKLLASFENETGILTLDYTLDGKEIWSFDCCGSGSAWVPATGAHIETSGTFEGPRTGIDCQSYLSDTEFSPDGRYWAAAACGGLVYVYEAQDEPGERAPTYLYLRAYALPFHKGSVTGVAFDPGGEVLASVGHDGMTKLWDMETGLELLTLSDKNVFLNGVDISPDGRHLATAAADGTISVYILSIEELMDEARSRLSRDFTLAECKRYLHLPTCPEE